MSFFKVNFYCVAFCCCVAFSCGKQATLSWCKGVSLQCVLLQIWLREMQASVTTSCNRAFKAKGSVVVYTLVIAVFSMESFQTRIKPISIMLLGRLLATDHWRRPLWLLIILFKELTSCQQIPKPEICKAQWIFIINRSFIPTSY